MGTAAVKGWVRRRPLLTLFVLSLLFAFTLQAAVTLPIIRSLAQQVDAGTAAADGNSRLRVLLNAGKATSAKYLVVDFDDPSMAGFGYRSTIPRGPLARAVEASINAHARAIVVDVDLGWDDPVESATLLTTLRHAETAKVPVFLVREPVRDEDRGVWALPPSALDELVEQLSYVRYATAVSADDEDHSRRRMAPAVKVCDGSHGDILLGAHVSAGVLLWELPVERALAIVDQASHPRTDCAGSGATDLRIAAGDTQLFLSAKDGGPRVDYVVTPATASTRGVTVFSGKLFADHGEGYDGAAFAGRMVLIGSSSRLGRDLHSTPVGDMPGIFILLNAIEQMGRKVVPREDAFWPPMLLTGLSSCLTFGVWLFLVTRFSGLNGEIRSEIIKTAVGVLWLVASWIAFSRSSLLAYAAPQYLLSVFLILADSLHRPGSRHP
ncbi:MAG: CHASE2 domain-containing protein [Caulobacter sp.]